MYEWPSIAWRLQALQQGSDNPLQETTMQDIITLSAKGKLPGQLNMITFYWVTQTDHAVGETAAVLR